MKRNSVIFFLCFIIGYPLLCQAKTEYIESGEYAYYRDTRGGMNFIRGYLTFRTKEGLIVLSRNIDVASNKSQNYYFIVNEAAKDSSSDIPLMIEKIVGADKQTRPEIIQACADFLNFVSVYDSSKSQFKDCKTVEDKWNDYTLLYDFNKALPLFRFNTITMKGSGKPSYVLLKGGSLNDDTAQQFLTEEFSFPEEIKRKDVSLKIPKKNKINVVLNELKARLDENWEYNEELGFPSYWLNVNGLRDSQIGVEKTDISVTGDLQTDDFFTRMARTAVKHYPSPDYNSVQFKITEKHTELSYFFLDENQRKNYQYYFFCKRDKNIYIVNFSTFADIYEANKSYFTDILSYVLKNNGLR